MTYGNNSCEISQAFTAEISAKLKEPFPPGEEQYRVGATWQKDGHHFTKPLAYIDARCVFDRLDEVVGPGGWATDLEKVSTGVYICRLTVLGVTRTDIGMAGDNEGEKEKSGASDAIKRAAVQFGIGRYLYEQELPAVQLNDKKQLPYNWKPNRPAAHQQAAQPVGAITPNPETAAKIMTAIKEARGPEELNSVLNRARKTPGVTEAWIKKAIADLRSEPSLTSEANRAAANGKNFVEANRR